MNVFSAEHQPALAIDPGDTVVARSLAARATSRAEALALASACADLRSTPVANVTGGCARCRRPARCPKLCQCSTQT